MRNDVFVSVKKEVKMDFIETLMDCLNVNGFHSVINLKSEQEWRFSEELREKIDECEHFILILSPVKDSENELEYIYQDVKYAIRAGKDIISICMPDFRFEKDLSMKLEEIRMLKSIKYVPEAKEDMIDELLSHLRESEMKIRQDDSIIKKLKKKNGRQFILKMLCTILSSVGLISGIHFIHQILYSNKEKARIESAEKESFQTEMKVRKVGDKEWKDWIEVSIGDEIECVVYYKNISDVIQKDVMVKVVSPKSSEYSNKSLLYNTAFPEKKELDADVNEKGVNIGDYASGGNAYVEVRYKIVGSDKLVKGKNRLRFWGEVGYGKSVLQDYVDIFLDI